MKVNNRTVGEKRDACAKLGSHFVSGEDKLRTSHYYPFDEIVGATHRCERIFFSGDKETKLVMQERSCPIAFEIQVLRVILATLISSLPDLFMWMESGNKCSNDPVHGVGAKGS